MICHKQKSLLRVQLHGGWLVTESYLILYFIGRDVLEVLVRLHQALDFINIDDPVLVGCKQVLSVRLDVEFYKVAFLTSLDLGLQSKLGVLLNIAYTEGVQVELTDTGSKKNAVCWSIIKQACQIRIEGSLLVDQDLPSIL